MPGTRPDSIRSAALAETSGRSGTGTSATTCAPSLRGDQGTVPRLASRLLGSPDIYGHEEREPDWGDDSHSLACTLWSLSGRFAVHLMASAYWEPLLFALPPPGGEGAFWHRLIDTALEAPEDIVPPRAARPIAADSYELRPRSLVLLLAHVG
jgi:isoamylase